MNEYKACIELSENINQDILTPLREFIKDQTQTANSHLEKWQVNNKEFKEGIDKLDKSRLDYHSLVKSAEMGKLELESLLNNPQISSDLRKKQNNKLNKIIKEAKDAEVEYIANIKKSNNLREKYVEVNKEIFQTFEQMEIVYTEQMKLILLKYMFYQTQVTKLLQIDVDKRTSILEGIDSKADLKAFINEKGTGRLPPHPFEFIPYFPNSSSIRNIDSTLISIDLQNSINQFIADSFITDSDQIDAY